MFSSLFFVRFPFFVISALLILLLLGCPARDDAEIIKIGVVGPMDHIQGKHHWNGATLAMEEINNAGGITIGDETYKIRLIRIDSKEMVDVAAAVSAVERAITVDEVDFLVGGFRTEAVFPMTEIAADYQTIFMICGSATDELLRGRVDVDYDRWKYLFRVTPIRSTLLAQISFIQLNDIINLFREEFGIDRPRVAILAERLEWNQALVRHAQQLIPAPRERGGLGAQLSGTWQPSAVATEVSAELEAIRRANTHIIYTVISGPVGVPFGRDWGRLEIPAAPVGIIVDAQQSGYLAATDRHGNYAATLNTYAPAGPMLEFFEKFISRFGEAPLFTAGTYDAIHIIKTAIDQAGTLDTDAIIDKIKNTDMQASIGRVVFDEYHDVKWGPGHVIGVGTQWQEGEIRAFWPYEWRPDPVNQPDLVITLDGAGPYQIAPWVKEHWRKELTER